MELENISFTWYRLFMKNSRVHSTQWRKIEGFLPKNRSKSVMPTFALHFNIVLEIWQKQLDKTYINKIELRIKKWTQAIGFECGYRDHSIKEKQSLRQMVIGNWMPTRSRVKLEPYLASYKKLTPDGSMT